MRRPRRAAVGVLSPRRALQLGKIRRRACLRLIPLPGTGDVLLAPTMISHTLAYVVPNPRQTVTRVGGWVCVGGRKTGPGSECDQCGLTLVGLVGYVFTSSLRVAPLWVVLFGCAVVV